MIYEFESYIEELRENPEKKEIIIKFEKFFGPIEGNYKDQNRYKDYVSKFNTLPFRVPEGLMEDFDWNFLMQLVASSFSSDGILDYSKEEENNDGNENMENQQEGLPEFIITVQSGDQVIVKKISELRSFQINRLYEIYIEEQLNLQILIAEDEKEKDAIESQRESRINRWNIVLENLETDKLKKEDEKERTGKLSDLMNQL